MIIGIGVDICENKRISHLLKKYDKRFLDRIFIQEEIDYCMAKRHPPSHLAARFALKEAFIKALNLPRNLTLSYKDVGLYGKVGKKDIIVNGHIKNLYKESTANKIFFSISHAEEYSTAYVILEKI